MRLPNGYGSITRLSGKRRHPYMVRVTSGWTDEGSPVRKVIGYYESRAKAISALSEYNEHPYDLAQDKTTFTDVWEKWCKITYTDKGLKVPNPYNAAWKRLDGIHSMQMCDIRRRHMQGEVDRCPLGYSTKKMMKTLCNKLFKLGIDCEIVTVNYAKDINLPHAEVSDKHHPFEPEELDLLWKHVGDPGTDIALVLSYTGMRPTELLKVRTENVHLDDHYLTGGMKTAAGRNRVIPIADKIEPIIRRWYNPDSEYLVISPKDGRPILTYDRLRSHIWERSRVLDQLPTAHLPHDGRHTCATMLDNAGVNLKTAQLILGHSSRDITRRVYTHKTINQLIEAINQI